MKSLLPVTVATRKGKRYLAFGKFSITVSEPQLQALGPCIELALLPSTLEKSMSILELVQRAPDQWNMAINDFRTALAKLSDKALQSWIQHCYSPSLLSTIYPIDQYPVLQSAIERNISRKAWDYMKGDLNPPGSWFENPHDIHELQFGAVTALVDAGLARSFKFPMLAKPDQRGDVSITPIGKKYFQLTVGRAYLVLRRDELRLLEVIVRLCQKAEGIALEQAALREVLDRYSSQPTAVHQSALRRLRPETAVIILRFSGSARLQRTWCSICSPAAAQWMKQQLSSLPRLETFPPGLSAWMNWTRPW